MLLNYITNLLYNLTNCDIKFNPNILINFIIYCIESIFIKFINFVIVK